MEITYLGHSSFKLRGKKVTVITDPFDPKYVGLKFPKTEADIVTVSHGHPDHNAASQVNADPFVIAEPGEYEVKGVSVIGVSSYHDAVEGKERGKNTMYNIDIDGIHILHLGDLGHTLTDKEIEAIGGVDILLVPVGGTYTITAKQAQELIPEIDPSIVIPMHYGRTDLDQETFASLTDLASFLKLVGGESTVPQAKLTITKDKLPDTMQIVVLES
jgi:L-ascorbate metabolism protein UlaG (beta-lactamase superfamily)